MANRYVGLRPGLPAFTIVFPAGLVGRVPTMTTQTGDTFAPFPICLIGLMCGAIALVVAGPDEHKQVTEIRTGFDEMRLSCTARGFQNWAVADKAWSIAMEGLPLFSRGERHGQASMGPLMETKRRDV